MTKTPRSAALRTGLRLCVALLAASVLVPGTAHAKKRLLFFTKSVTFEHPVIKRTGPEPSHAGGVLAELGKKRGWEIFETKDGRWLTQSSLATFDGVIFQTTDDLTKLGLDKQPPMPPEGKAWLIDAINAGKAFIAIHNGSDSFHSPPPRRKNNVGDVDPYIALVGGEFISHGEQQDGKVLVVDPKFPGLSGVKDATFTVKEEWYSLKNLAGDMHAVLVLDTTGMTGADYQRPKYPIAWARQQGKGRVFFTALGHREDVWTNPIYQEHLAGGIAWALGEAKAEIKPNKLAVAPEADTMPPEPAPKKK